jgi:hypothetical protein
LETKIKDGIEGKDGKGIRQQIRNRKKAE